MKGAELLEYYENNWKTSMGGWFPGERVVVRGHDLFRDFKGSSWLEYLLFVTTGKKDSKLAELIGQLWTFTGGFPDPRIWNNRVVTLAATANSTGALGVSAGIAVSEATLYGLKPITACCDFLVKVKAGLEQGGLLKEILNQELQQGRTIYGFGRPVTTQDERIAPTLKLVEENKLSDGYYLSLVFEIETFLKEKYGISLNQGGLYGAILLDSGLSVKEIYYLTIFLFSVGMFAPFIEAHEKPEGSFFPLRVSKINYVGDHEVRAWGG